MARRVAVVTVSNSGYFRLLQGLVLSLEAADADVDVCFPTSAARPRWRTNT